MRAVAFDTFGGPEVLSVVDADVPQPQAGHVRIRVAAAPVQPADVNVRRGLFGPMIPAGRTYILGWDAAGVVDAVGAGVAEFAVGDSVVGWSQWLMTQVGTHAEYVVLPTADVAPAPAGLTPQVASTLPANALTAMQALDLMNTKEGQTLAVTGASGAVGGFAVELARLRGLSVLAIAAARDEPFLRERGARLVPRTDDPAGALRAVAPAGVDHLLDAASLGESAIGAVRDGGTFASVVPPATPQSQRGIQVVRVMLHGDREGLRDVLGLAERGDITGRVAETFALEDAADAHALFEKGGLRGRVVLAP